MRNKGYILGSAATFGLFFTIFVAALFVAVRIFPQGPIVPLGINLLINETALFLVAIIVFFKKSKKEGRLITNFVLIQSLALALVTSTLFLMTGPALADRSLTLFMLTNISQDQGSTAGRLSEISESNWWHGMDQIDSRLREQVEAGLLKVEPNGVYVATARGELVVTGTKILTRIFNLNVVISGGGG